MDGFDPCECINLLSHQARMQRLISMLQDTQSDCTDSECFTDGASLQRESDGYFDGGLALWKVMIGWVLLAVVLYFMRPAASTKPRGLGPSNGPSSDHRRDQDPAPVM